MNAAHLHLALNHLPIFALAFALVVLGWGRIRRERIVVSLGLALTVLAGAGAGAAFLTGEPAEEVIEDRPGIDEARIHEHEEAAEFAVWLTIAAAVVAAGALWYHRRGEPYSPAALTATMVVGLVAMASLTVTAWHGGEISHPEIRASASGPAATGADDD